MNNLLRTLTRYRGDANPEELRVLLNTVKDGRTKTSDAKQTLSDAFYDSLEEVLNDMKAMTMDNHDAEAFQKPVSKTEVPDYYDYITNPMDFQTMTKKVKQKQYKSKREFKADLDLIWSNCLTYNAAENHPLRKCAKRLQVKADKLLAHITDKKERTDPNIPNDLQQSASSLYRVHLGVNGTQRSSTSGVVDMQPVSYKKFNLGSSFEDAPAIERTAEGMRNFVTFERDLSKETLSSDLEDLLAKLLDNETADSQASTPMDEDESVAGDKRKMNGDHSPRKKSKKDHSREELVEYGLQSDYFIGNGLPSIRTRSCPPERKRRRKKPSAASESSLFSRMNNNIQALHRVRRTHGQIMALLLEKEENSEMRDQPRPILPPLPMSKRDEQPWIPPGEGLNIGQDAAQDCLEWSIGKILEHTGFQGASRGALDMLIGVMSDYMSNLGRTLQYLAEQRPSSAMTSEQIITHALFESGVPQIQDLESYVNDDIVRYGARLEDLDKKLALTYTDLNSAQLNDEDNLFEEEEAEDGAFVLSNFADMIGEDLLGLRDIASEFGMSNFVIPRRLLRGRNRGDNRSSTAPKAAAVPFPPPPPYPPLDTNTMKDQIGLLYKYYDKRANLLIPLPPPPPPVVPVLAPVGSITLPPPLSGPSLAGTPANPNVLPSAPNSAYTLPAAPVSVAPPAPAPSEPLPSPLPPQSAPVVVRRPSLIVIPDDLPNPANTKIGPTGTVIIPNTNTNTKKKAKKDGDSTQAKKPTTLASKAPKKDGSMFNGPPPVVRVPTLAGPPVPPPIIAAG